MDGLERGPPYYPELPGWVPGLRFRSGGGGWQDTNLAARLQATGLKDGTRPHVGNPQVSETDHFHCAAPQYPRPELECMLAISCCQPPDPPTHEKHVPMSWNLKRD